jgi:hypothetical protein
MALKKTSGEGSPRKASAKKASSKKAAPKAAQTKKTAPKAAQTKKTAASGSAKKSSAIKLTPAQQDVLKKVAGASPAGYHASKKPETKSLESLLKRKLVKRAGKSSISGSHAYKISSSGSRKLASLTGGLPGETDTDPPKPKR